MKQILGVAMLLALTFPNTSLAGLNEANSCADGLSENSQKIYREVFPKLESGVNARAIMVATVRQMVETGEIEPKGVHSNAQAAAMCLMKLQD